MTKKIKKEENKATNQATSQVADTQTTITAVENVIDIKKVMKPVAQKKTEELSASDKLWDEIKDIEISMFGLPYQKVSEIFNREKINPDQVYLTTKISAAMPLLEQALGNKYSVEMTYKFIVVSRQ